MLVADTHPLARAGEVDWGDLGGDDLLWFARELAPGYHDAVLSTCHVAGWRPRHVREGQVRRGTACSWPSCGTAAPSWRCGHGGTCATVTG